MKQVLNELEDKGFKAKLNYNLEKAYDEALEKPEFKKLVMDLKVARKFLIKYTSILEKSAVEYDNCSKCKGLLECKNQVTGYCYLPRLKDEKIIFEYKMCKYNEKYQKETEYQKNVYINHIPEDIKNASWKDIYTNDKKRFETIEYLQKFINNYKKNQHQKGLYLNGSFGCGKTYLVSAAFNELAKKGYKSAIVFWPEFLLELKSSFDSDFKEKYDYVKTVPLLLIDDIGAENNTEWSRDDIFCPLIQYRMENHLPTFFTSNLTIDDLKEHFASTKNKVDNIKSRRIIERVEQLTNNIFIDSKNLRK
ncbi:MAG: primosomal protein DnaI [Bacilli bacterium]|nr:primosomal protein DnaI [Bacilli bacterium]